MYLNISNSGVTATGNTIVRPATAEESYKRYDGGTQKDIVQVYADNYVLNLNNNTIKDEKGSGNNIKIYGNYEKFQQGQNPTWTNSITAKGNVISNTSTETPLVKIYNDVTYAPVAWPDDYEVTDAAKALAKQLKTENTTLGGSCLLDILCRANGKVDSNQQLNGDE